MSLNMYLGETSAQTSSMKTMCEELIKAMDETKSSITAFMFALTLKGKAYDSAKTFMAKTYYPLAQGIIYLSEELIHQHEAYPNEFKSQVAPTDVVEQEILDQISEINRLIAKLRAINTVPLSSVSISILESLKRELENKLEKLYTYNNVSANNYETAIKLAMEISKGLAELQNGNGFNRSTGTFSTKGMDLDWVTELDNIHYEKLAHDQYAEYLEEFPQDLDKVVEIIKYEELHPEDKKRADEFLSPLEQQDIIGIKYLMYTAEEPYREMTFEYLDRLELSLVEVDPNDKNAAGPSYFTDADNKLTYVYERDRENPRGNYFTFFHELGHAIDYNYGKDNGMDGFYSDSYKIDGLTLRQHMQNDVEDKIKSELKNELNKEQYDNWDEQLKEETINNVTDTFIYEELPTDMTLTKDEKELYGLVRDSLRDELNNDVDHNASDIYGGVTVNEIVGKWAHHEESYWIDTKTGERINSPNKEGFASFYGSQLLEEGDQRNEQLSSMETYIPDSNESMTKMFEEMNVGEE